MHGNNGNNVRRKIGKEVNMSRCKNWKILGNDSLENIWVIQRKE